MDFVAAAFELIGLYLVGNKNRLAFLFNIVGMLCWFYVALSTHVYGLFLIGVPSLVLNGVNYWKWGRAPNIVV